MRKIDCCPLCDQPYGLGHNHPRRNSRHHIFPRRWYPDSTLIVPVCQTCHDEFNREYQNKARERWSKVVCVRMWCAFCLTMGKNATRVYPELIGHV